MFGDGAGRVVALGERDCSLQRRNQKVVEETPAPHLPAGTRAGADRRRRAAGRSAADYRSAGTVEFLYDAGTRRLLLPRGQHPAAGRARRHRTGHRRRPGRMDGPRRGGRSRLPRRLASKPAGRLDPGAPLCRGPGQDFRPSCGVLTEVRFPRDARVETWVAAGTEVSAFYDPLLAKLIVTAPDRDAAVRALQAALDHTGLARPRDQSRLAAQVARSEAFVSGQVSTALAQSIHSRRRPSGCSAAASATTVQDYPGPSGLLGRRRAAHRADGRVGFRLGNRLLGNPPEARGAGDHRPGPDAAVPARRAHLPDRAPISRRASMASPSSRAPPLLIRAGQTLKLGRVRGGGMRGYLLFAGGIDVPVYLGSRATFTLGGFGGHAGRALAAGDVLHLGAARHGAGPAGVNSTAQPRIDTDWTLRVLYGPHGAPDFFTADDIAMLRKRVVEGALQLQPHRRAPDRPQAALGAARWRRGGAAPLEHPRQCLCHRRGRFHRRHADHPGARRPLAGRLRLPVRGDPGRPVEGRSAGAG